MPLTDRKTANRSIVTGDQTVPAFTTTVNTYADVGVLPCRLYRTKHVKLSVTTQNLHIKILGSFDGGVTYPVEETAETQVNAGATTLVAITDYYTHMKVQTKPVVADTHGTLNVQMAGASF